MSTIDELPVSDVMSRALLTVGPEETVLMAWELLNRAGFHHLPGLRRTAAASESLGRASSLSPAPPGRH